MQAANACKPPVQAAVRGAHLQAPLQGHDLQEGGRAVLEHEGRGEGQVPVQGGGSQECGAAAPEALSSRAVWRYGMFNRQIDAHVCMVGGQHREELVRKAAPPPQKRCGEGRTAERRGDMACWTSQGDENTGWRWSGRLR